MELCNLIQNQEIWRPCPDYEDIYDVSSFGRIRRNKRTRRNPEKRILKISLNTRGYPIICLTKNSKRTTKKVHRLVAKAFLKPAMIEKNQVNHIDGNKANNHISNLEWVTNRENCLHAIRMGLWEAQHKRSLESTPKKISLPIANTIRELAQSGIVRRVLAAKFNLHVASIGEIIRNETWRV